MLKPVYDGLPNESIATWALVFKGNKILSCKTSLDLPQINGSMLEWIKSSEMPLFQLFDLHGQEQSICVLDLPEDTEPPHWGDWVSIRQLMMATQHDAFGVIGRAWQYVYFQRTHKYCGLCGNETEPVDAEMAAQCTACSHRFYPRVSPCVIVAIHRPNEILLAKGIRHQKTNMFSTIAGFVESGETLEQAVHREVREEVNVKVNNIQYFASQPWPFPHSLMVGYTAQWSDGAVKPDLDEIVEAAWFKLDELPLVPPKFSIAGRLIDKVRAIYQ